MSAGDLLHFCQSQRAQLHNEECYSEVVKYATVMHGNNTYHKLHTFFCPYAVTTFIFANNKFLSTTNSCKGPHEVTELQTMRLGKWELKLKHTMQAYFVNNTNPFINMTQIPTSRNAEPFILLIQVTNA